MKKKYCDRKDGTRIRMNGFDRFLYCLKKKRSEAEVYISRDIDVTNLVNYMQKKKKENEKITYFHLFSMAMAKVLYNNSYLNRFIIGGEKYQRNEITLSFVAKQEFKDDSPECMAVVNVDATDNVNSLSQKILGDVKKIRSNKSSGVDNLVDFLGKLPKFIMNFIVWFICKLDNHDLIPRSLTKGSLYHSSVLISNLGSIHCDGIYHNLTNFGTCSIVCTIGEITEKPFVIDDKIQKRNICNFGICLDERIADGVYFAKCINMLEYILKKPELLEDHADAKIDLNKNK